MLIRFLSLLEDYAISTGLQVNYHKSSLIPMIVDGELVGQLAENFGWVIGDLPFTYLGLPLGTTKPRIQDFSPLLDRVERRLTASACFLSHGGETSTCELSSVLPADILQVLFAASPRKNCYY